MDEERDYVIFEDESGNEIELDIVDQFPYGEKEYAVLMDLSKLLDENSEIAPDELDTPSEMYVMEIVMEGDQELFIPIEDEELLSKLSDLIYERINQLEEDLPLS